MSHMGPQVTHWDPYMVHKGPYLTKWDLYMTKMGLCMVYSIFEPHQVLMSILVGSKNDKQTQ